MGMSSLWLTAGGTKIVKETEWNKFMSECDNKSGIRPFLKRSEWRLGRLIDRFMSIEQRHALDSKDLTREILVDLLRGEKNEIHIRCEE